MEEELPESKGNVDVLDSRAGLTGLRPLNEGGEEDLATREWRRMKETLDEKRCGVRKGGKITRRKAADGKVSVVNVLGFDG